MHDQVIAKCSMFYFKAKGTCAELQTDKCTKNLSFKLPSAMIMYEKIKNVQLQFIVTKTFTQNDGITRTLLKGWQNLKQNTSYPLNFLKDD